MTTEQIKEVVDRQFRRDAGEVLERTRDDLEVVLNPELNWASPELAAQIRKLLAGDESVRAEVEAVLNEQDAESNIDLVTRIFDRYDVE